MNNKTCDFINSISISNNYKDNMRILNELIENINDVRELDYSEELIKLIDKSNNLKAIIGSIVTYYHEIISTDEIYNVIKNDKILLFIKVYCDLNDITFGKDYSDEDLVYDDSYVSDDSFKTYMREVSAYKLLTREQEIELGKRIKNGDETAEKEMVVHNLKLVIYIAKKYLGRGIDIKDLVQEGNFGLMKAATKYDYEKGFKFATYATWWIRQAIAKSLPEYKTIRVPLHVDDDYRKLLKAINELNIKLNREPSERELANYLNWNLKKVLFVKRSYLEVTSLELEIGEDNDGQLKDILPDENSVAPDDEVTDGMFKKYILEFLNDLPEKERNIILYRYPLNGNKPLTLEEVGSIYNISKERVRQIEARGLLKLRRRQAVKEFARDYIPDIDIRDNYYEYLKQIRGN